MILDYWMALFQLLSIRFYYCVWIETYPINSFLSTRFQYGDLQFFLLVDPNPIASFRKTVKSSPIQVVPSPQ